MNAKPLLDTNVLVYAFTARSSASQDRRTAVAEEILAEGGMVSVQVLTEFSDVMARKHGKSWPMIAEMLESIELLCGTAIPLEAETHKTAVALSLRYDFRIYDSMILAAALDASCDLVYTEDLRHGQIIEGLKIVNPFLNSGDTLRQSQTGDA